MKATGGQSGFSLLEILIAVGILATSFVALLSLQGSSLLSFGRAERLTTATLLAQQRMAELEISLEKDIAKNKFPDDMEEAGEFEEPFGDYRWKVSVRKVEIPVSAEGLPEGTNSLVGSYMETIGEEISKAVREVKLTVFWGDKDKPEEEQQSLAVTTHIVNLKQQSSVLPGSPPAGSGALNPAPAAP